MTGGGRRRVEPMRPLRAIARRVWPSCSARRHGEHCGQPVGIAGSWSRGGGGAGRCAAAGRRDRCDVGGTVSAAAGGFVMAANPGVAHPGPQPAAGGAVRAGQRAEPADPDWRDLVAGWATGRAGGLAAAAEHPPHLSPGLLMLICGDVIRPSLAWLVRFAPARRGLADELARAREPAAFARLADMCHDAGLATQTGQTALTRIGLMMAAKGGTVADVTVGDCLQLVEVTDQVGAKVHGGVHNPLFYQLLRNLGGFGDDAPAALRVFSGPGQPTCAQLIDRYRIACRPVRDLLVDYLSERKLVNDFSSLQHLAYLLGKLFWADLEAHHPDIDTLRLPRDVAAAWKQRVMTRTRTTRTRS